MEKRLPSRDDILAFVAEHDHAVPARDIANRFDVAEGSYPALLRMLDHIAVEGELYARDDDKFKSAKKGAKDSARPPAPIAPPRVLKGIPARKEATPVAPKAKHDDASRFKSKNEPTRFKAKDERARDKSNDYLPGFKEEKGAPRSKPSQDAPSAKPNERPRPLNANEREGTISINARGFGFVSSVGASGDDVFVGHDGLMGAMHGDRVIVRVRGRGARGPEGELVRIVERGTKRVAGILRRRGRSAWLEPDDQRVRGPIPLPEDLDAKAGEGNSGNDGDVAIVVITRFPELPDETPIGKLEAVLGKPGELRVEVQKTLMLAQISEVHSEKAFQEAEAYGTEVPKEMLEGREDLTHLPLPTIDPEDARDHDDAVWVERTPEGGYRAWIAIADVSTYVRPGTILDEESKTRGCSVYLPDRAIPMLPRPLSSNLCSLLPDVLRLCLCVEVVLDRDAKILSRRLIRGFMKSRAKLTYGGVARALGFSELPPVDPKAEAMKDDLAVAAELSRSLRAQRMERGALDFELPEPKIFLGEDGQPEDVKKRTSDPGLKKAYSLIEELMLLANEVVAQWLVEKQLPTIFRVHAAPDEKKLQKFVVMAESLGIEFDMDEARDPKKLSQLLKRIADHPLSQVLNMLLLRSMKQATYDITNVGHFGLASKAYLHFTSPIRRYPDLVVHRSVHDAVLGKAVSRSDETREKLAESALAASMAERRAMEAEREVVDLYRAVLMRSKIGERFEGTVTSVVGSGVFVVLDSPFVDVLVKLEDLGVDRYEVDDDAMKVVAQRSGDSISLGDRILVDIIDVGIQRRTVYGRRVHEGDATDITPRSPWKKTPTGDRGGAPDRGGKPGRDRGRGGVPSRGRNDSRKQEQKKKTDRTIEKRAGKFDRKAGTKKSKTKNKGKKRR